MTFLAFLDVIVVDMLACLALPLSFVLPVVVWFELHCCSIVFPVPHIQWGVILFGGLCWLIALCALVFVGVVSGLAYCACPLSWAVGG